MVSKKDISENEFKKLNSNIESVTQISREKISKGIAKSLKNQNRDKVIATMPFFFTIHLSRYLNSKEVEKIKEKILKLDGIKSVETFGKNHSTKYNLFMFIKLLFWSFVGLISLVSIFLVIKQMEVWQMAHARRMHIMEIFGAPVLLRSGILLKMGVVDAVISVLLTSGIFLWLKYQFIPKSGIDILIAKEELLFKWWDVLVMFGVSLSIVLLSVVVVTFSNKGVEE